MGGVANGLRKSSGVWKRGGRRTVSGTGKSCSKRLIWPPHYSLVLALLPCLGWEEGGAPWWKKKCKMPHGKPGIGQSQDTVWRMKKQEKRTRV